MAPAADSSVTSLPMEMPVLVTPRLVIRPFTLEDLAKTHQLLDGEIENPIEEEPRLSLADRKTWLEWTVLNYRQLALLYQPPYGDRAVVHEQSGELIGACGLVPSLGPFNQYSQFRQKCIPCGTRKIHPGSRAVLRDQPALSPAGIRQ